MTQTTKVILGITIMISSVCLASVVAWWRLGRSKRIDRRLGYLDWRGPSKLYQPRIITRRNP
jgi:hypothetical protein